MSVGPRTKAFSGVSSLGFENFAKFLLTSVSLTLPGASVKEMVQDMNNAFTILGMEFSLTVQKLSLIKI